MKKLVLITLAAMAMASCSQGEDEGLNNDPMKIHFGAGINVTTKAAIESGADGLPTKEITDIQILRGTDGENSTFDFTKGVEITGVLATTGALTVSPDQHFAANKSAANFMAFHPAGAFSAGKVAYTIDGATDIIVADKTTAAFESPVQFTFKHKLARVKLVVKAKDQGAADVYGNLTAATISVPTALDLTIAADGTTTITANATPANAALSFGTATLTTEGGAALNELMILPAVPPTTITLAFEKAAANGYNITGLKLEAGTITTITATVNAKDVSFTSTVEQWKEGGENGETEIK